MAWMIPAAITASALIGANASRGGGDQTVSNEPWYYQQAYLQDLFGKAQGAQASGQLAPVAGFDPLELLGQQQTLDAAGNQLPMLGQQAMGAYGQLMNAGNVQNNPVLQQYIQAALRPMTQNLQQNILPGIRNEALVSGNYGGTRQGIAEGMALQENQAQSADVSTRIMQDAYARGLQAMQGGLAQTGNVAGAIMAPSTAVGSVGTQRRTMDQAELDRTRNSLQAYQSLISGNFGSNVTTPGAQGNPWMGALGGAMVGNSMRNLWQQPQQQQWQQLPVAGTDTANYNPKYFSNI